MSSDAAVLGRLTILVGAVVLLDTAFYAVIAPLLPGLTHSLHLSKLGAGVLTACYPAGMLVASIPAGIFAMRVGPRVSVCLGLTLLVCSTVAFAFLHSAPALDLARFVEGVGGALSWAAGIAWLMAVAPSERRGAVIGRAMSAAIAGAVAGPAIGAIAAGIGRPLLFCAISALGVLMIAVTRTMPAGHATEPVRPARTATAELIRRPIGAAALWMMALPAIVSGTVTVLAPLALHALGAGSGVIGATFLVAAGVETIVSTWVGGLSDRHGRLMPLALAFIAISVALACFTLPHRAAILVVVVAGVSASTGFAWTPAMALLSELSDSVGLDQALGAGLMNVAWALGQIVGSSGSGALARADGNLLPTAIIAGLCLCTALGILAARRTPALSVA